VQPLKSPYLYTSHKAPQFSQSASRNLSSPAYVNYSFIPSYTCPKPLPIFPNLFSQHIMYMCRRIPIVWTARYQFRGVERRTMVYHSDRELPIAYNGLANFIGQKFTHLYFSAHMGLWRFASHLMSFRGNGSTSRTSLVNTLSMRALLPARPPLGRHSMNTLHTCPSLIIVLVMSLILLNKTNNVKP